MAVTKIPIGARTSYRNHATTTSKHNNKPSQASTNTNTNASSNSFSTTTTTTLRYGSDDGGVTIHEDARVYELTKQFGARLNQAPHKIEGAKEPFYGPFDLEYHAVQSHDVCKSFL
jgi:hypothetical protein